ncbi:MAG: hypothetical protein ACJAW8_001436 [Oleispira sp.]|jgi:hypothetical protein
MIYTRLLLLLTISFSSLSCTTFANPNIEESDLKAANSIETNSVETNSVETNSVETNSVETNAEETISAEADPIEVSDEETVTEETTSTDAIPEESTIKKTVQQVDVSAKKTKLKEEVTAVKTAIKKPASGATNYPYPEFTAEYNATWTGGWFPINVDAQRSLSYQADGTATLTFEADSAIAGLQEISTFRYLDNTIQPLQYRYLRTGLFKEPDRNQVFDWQKKQIINGDNQSIFKGHWNDLVQDNLSYNVQASIDLQQGKTQFTYPVFDRNKVKNFSFQMVGFEVLNTQVGSLRTVKIEQIEKKKHKKKTYIWFAKDYDYLLVRLQQTQKDGQTYQIDLTAADINGKTLRKALD